MLNGELYGCEAFTVTNEEHVKPREAPPHTV